MKNGFLNDMRRGRLRRIQLAVNTAVTVALLGFVLIAPGFLLAGDLLDPAWRTPCGIPRVAWRVHRALTKRWPNWARRRIASGAATRVVTADVPSTEWAMFGSVFYLMATENLQREWEKQAHPRGPAPAVYARDAVNAAAEVLLDPGHHTWVRRHWGDGYLHEENIFFRAMLTQGLLSRECVLHDGRDMARLRDQCDSLAAELDASPHGLLHDYPGECYPCDIFSAWAAIRRADAALGWDHAAQIARARRGFVAPTEDALGLTPYVASPESGAPLGPSRGIGMSYQLVLAPELYPDLAQHWMARYEEHFWQNRGWAAGFREFPRGWPGAEWTYDVDAGPILQGFGPSANAYGVAAARANGRYDLAWTLSAQVLAASWPLPNGRLLGGRMLSNPAHAPYLGEANLLWLFTVTPAAGTAIRSGGELMPQVGIAFVLFGGLGGMGIASAIRFLRREWRVPARAERFALQWGVWAGVTVLGVILLVAGQPLSATLCLVSAHLLPCPAARRNVSAKKDSHA